MIYESAYNNINYIRNSYAVLWDFFSNEKFKTNDNLEVFFLYGAPVVPTIHANSFVRLLLLNFHDFYKIFHILYISMPHCLMKSIVRYQQHGYKPGKLHTVIYHSDDRY